MLSFEVWVNGKKQFTVGAEKAEEYGIYLSMQPDLAPDFAMLEASGYLPSDNEYNDVMKWGNISVKDGDEIIIKMKNTNQTDSPSITEQGTGLVSNQAHAMLCSSCGKSHQEVNGMVTMGRITLCNKCASALVDISINEKET